MPSNLVQSSSTFNVRSKLLDLRFIPCSLLPARESILVISSYSFPDISNAWRVPYIHSSRVTRSIRRHAGDRRVDGELVESHHLLATRPAWTCNICHIPSLYPGILIAKTKSSLLVPYIRITICNRLDHGIGNQHPRSCTTASTQH
jgi:hypothetical protein